MLLGRLIVAFLFGFVLALAVLVVTRNPVYALFTYILSGNLVLLTLSLMPVILGSRSHDRHGAGKKLSQVHR